MRALLLDLLPSAQPRVDGVVPVSRSTSTIAGISPARYQRSFGNHHLIIGMGAHLGPLAG
ncbi:hypothetical protein C5E51_29550 [Nocardia nova]|nr:hypothetical protein C5E51_29550 [Nocardia nova]